MAYEVHLQEALAGLIASTNRMKRKPDLLQVAEWIETARQGLGSLRAVAECVDLSTEMIRQFASVRKLSPAIKRMVKERKIDSVDVAHRLSKLSPADQSAVALSAQRGELNSEDVRAVVSLRKSIPNAPISEVIRRIQESRNIREYLVEFLVPSQRSSEKALRGLFGDVVGRENIRWISKEEGAGVLALNLAGLKLLSKKARARGLTKRAFVDRLLAGGMNKGSV